MFLRNRYFIFTRIITEIIVMIFIAVCGCLSGDGGVKNTDASGIVTVQTTIASASLPAAAHPSSGEKHSQSD